MSFSDYMGTGFSAFFNNYYFSHLLFIMALCGVYTLRSWKLVSSFVLAFIGGYLLTFILAFFQIVEVPTGQGTPLLQGILVPITILITALANFSVRKKAFINRYPNQNYRYYLAVIAGAVHGFAFEQIIKPPRSGILEQLFGYNLGIIAGIAVLVFTLLFTAFLLTYFLRVRLREWNLILSGACAGIAIFKILLRMY